MVGNSWEHLIRLVRGNNFAMSRLSQTHHPQLQDYDWNMVGNSEAHPDNVGKPYP